MIIRQTTLDLRHLFLTETDLAGARAGIADSEDGNRVPFTTVALGATRAMANDAFEQRAAEDVGGVGEARGKAVAFLYELQLFHYT